MAKSVQESRVLNMPVNYVVGKMRSIGNSNLRMVLRSENPMPNGGVWFRIHHGMSFTSYGEKITVTLTAAGPGSTQINIVSECGMPTQVIDWGKNRSNITALFDYIVRP